MSAVAVEIVECHRDFVVAFKAAGVHSAPLKADDADSALSFVAQNFPQILAVQGKKAVEGGLIHRIDYDTAGLLLFALNQEFYNHIMACQDEGLFKKGYVARCHYDSRCTELLGGFPPLPVSLDFSADHQVCTVESSFRAFGPGRKQVRPVTEQSGKFSQRKAGGSKQGSSPLYSTELSITKTLGKNFVVKASITKGYRHQVRCHLAWCGLPIVADPLYHPLEKTAPQMQFFATGLSFPLMEAQETAPLRTTPKASQSSKLFSMDISSRILSSL